jgi:methylase of polypeptide subunit release factors
MPDGTKNFVADRKRQTRYVHIYLASRILADKPSVDLQHHLFAMTFDGALGLCPLNSREVEVNRVLDVGTGTGIWAMDYGAFP